MDLSEEELGKLQSVFGAWGLETEIKSVEDLKKMVLPTKVKTEQEEAKHTEDARRWKRSEIVIPKLPSFSGKTEVNSTPFEVWRYDVECIMREQVHSPEVINESIRRSLKGEAAKVLVRLGPNASPQEVLNKLDGLYSKVATESTLLTQFYAAQQKDNEDVTSWCCRLEELIDGVERKGLISRGTKEEMLRSKFWTGLRDEKLKSATRFKYDTLKDYEELVISIRRVEQELMPERVKAKTQAVQRTKEDSSGMKTPENTKTQEVLMGFDKRLQKIEESIKEMKQNASNHSQSRDNRWKLRGRGRGQGREQRTSRDKDGARGREHTTTENRGGADAKGSDIVCYRCGQSGHIALGCRVRLDHLKDH